MTDEALLVGWAEGRLDDGTMVFCHKQNPSAVSSEQPSMMAFFDSKELAAVHAGVGLRRDGAGRRDGSTRKTAETTTKALDALNQALCHGATVLAAVAGGEDCKQATRTSQIRAAVSTSMRRQFEIEERTLADRHNPRCESLERRRHAFLQTVHTKTASRALRRWRAGIKAQQEKWSQKAASIIQRQWRARSSQRHARHIAKAAASPKAGSPYDQLRDLLLKYPQLQNGLYAAAAADVSRPWMKAMVGDGRELADTRVGPPHHTESPRRQAARANLRKLERWLLHDSSTREELLELLGDHELRRIALLRKLDACSSEQNKSATTVDLFEHGTTGGRAGAAELQEVRATERLAANQAEKIRHRVRERSMHLSASTSAPTISIPQLSTPQPLQHMQSSECVAETHASARSSTRCGEIRGAELVLSPRLCAAESEKVIRSNPFQSSTVSNNPTAVRRGKASKYDLKNRSFSGSDNRMRQPSRRSARAYRIDDRTSDVADGRSASVETIVQQVKLDAIQHRRLTTFAVA